MPHTSVPTSWFRDPLDQAIRKLVRPSTMLTRRKELTILKELPREVFEDFMSTLSEGDAEGLARDLVTQKLVPTTTTAALHHFKYVIKRWSVSDKLFHLESLDPAPKVTAQVETIGVGEEDVFAVEAILESRQKGNVTQFLIKWEGWSEDYNSWEPAAHIDPSIVAVFLGQPPPPRLPASHPKRGAGGARAQLSRAAEKRGEIPQSISMVCGCVMVHFKQSRKEEHMPSLKLVFQVLTLTK